MIKSFATTLELKSSAKENCDKMSADCTSISDNWCDATNELFWF